LAPKANYLRTIRALAEAWQAFDAYSGAHVRSLGLTPAQFDIVATLGDTPGMTCKELGEKTLITKGTLTGVLDRMEARKLIRRQPSEADRRSIFISLTPQGERLFEKVFPAHIGHCNCACAKLSVREHDSLTSLLRKLRDSLREEREAGQAA